MARKEQEALMELPILAHRVLKEQLALSIRQKVHKVVLALLVLLVHNIKV